jgi:hypothetical protein
MKPVAAQIAQDANPAKRRLVSMFVFPPLSGYADRPVIVTGSRSFSRGQLRQGGSARENARNASFVILRSSNYGLGTIAAAPARVKQR